MKIININQVPEGGLTFNWLEDGVLCGRFANKLHIDLESAKETINVRRKFSGKKSYPFLQEACDPKLISKNAKDYFASPEGTADILATAIMTTSALNMIMGNIALVFKKPNVPTRFFTGRKEAKKWLITVCATEIARPVPGYRESNSRDQFSYA